MAETTGLKIQKMPTNPQEGDVDVNAALDLIDAATCQHVAINFTSDADYTLDTSATISEWQYAVIEMTDTGGVLTGATNVVLPNNERVYFVKNSTAQTLTFKTAAGSGVSLGTSNAGVVFCDGTDILNALVGVGGLTYSISSEIDSNGVNITLTGSDASLDQVYLVPGTGMTITHTDANTITLSATGAASILDMPTLSKSVDYTVAGGDQGYLILGQETSFDLTFTLPAAATAGDGFTVGFKNLGSVTSVIIAAAGAETIDGASSISLTGQYDAAILQCDGTGWHVVIKTSTASGVSSSSVNSWTAGQSGAITALSDAATITPNMSDGNFFSVTLAGNRTLANPTNLVAGQSGSIFITQDGTGSRTLAYGSYWDFVGGTAPVLSTTAGTVDRLDYVVRTTGSIHAVLTKGWS